MLLRASTLAFLSAPAFCQTLPVFRNIDGNGVDLVYGDFVFGFEEGSIGGGQNRLVLTRRNGGAAASQWDGYRLARAASSQNVTIITDTTSEFWTFNATTGTFSNGLADGASLVRAGNEYVLTDSGGNKIRFAPTSLEAAQSINVCWQGNARACVLEPLEFIAPNGLSTLLTHDTWIMRTFVNGEPTELRAWWRIKQISQSADVFFRFNYQNETTPPFSDQPPKPSVVDPLGRGVRQQPCQCQLCLSRARDGHRHRSTRQPLADQWRWLLVHPAPARFSDRHVHADAA